jgi:hypothetical protein
MSYFRNVQNSGNWVAGNTYTFEAYYIADKVQHPLGYSSWAWLYGYYQNYGDGYALPNPYFTIDYAQEIFDVDDVAVGSLAYQQMFSGTYHPSGGETTEIITQEYITLPQGASYWKEYLWKRYTITIPVNIVTGNYKLVWAQNDPSNSIWEDNLAGVITESETFDIHITGGILPPPDPVTPTIPDTRPVDYDNDLYWVPGVWVDDVYIPPHWAETPITIVAAGGGRYNQNLVVAGHNLVYYEEFS